MNIKLEGLDALMQRLDDMGGDIEATSRRAMTRAVNLVEASAIKRCRGDTGLLRESITSSVKSENGTIEGTVGTNVAYAPYVEFGTGYVGGQSPHPLDAELGITRSHPVKTYNKKDGSQTTVQGWVYYDELHQRFCFTRGQPARPFLYPALKENQRNITEIFKEELSK